jgi:hypothetical protein
MRMPRSLAVASLLACTFLSAGCQMHEPWMFTVTRTMNDTSYADDLVGSCQCDGRLDEVALAVLLAPFVIDFVLLPITWTHDCIVCE